VRIGGGACPTHTGLKLGQHRGVGGVAGDGERSSLAILVPGAATEQGRLLGPGCLPQHTPPISIARHARCPRYFYIPYIGFPCVCMCSLFTHTKNDGFSPSAQVAPFLRILFTFRNICRFLCVSRFLNGSECFGQKSITACKNGGGLKTKMGWGMRPGDVRPNRYHHIHF
jgi:hypothetical protein